MADHAKAKRLAKERMKCNSPRRDVQGGKKFVVKACEDGKEKIIRYGDANMEIKRDNPERRKNFRARHNCDEQKSKLTAGYWSCRAWSMLPFLLILSSVWSLSDVTIGGMFA